MRIVIALGGNALLCRGEAPELETQRRNVRIAATAIAPIAWHHEIVITHGNGPQIGLLALQAAAYRAVRPYPLDLLGAESEGMVGYLLNLALTNALAGRDMDARRSASPTAVPQRPRHPRRALRRRGDRQDRIRGKATAHSRTVIIGAWLMIAKRSHH